MDGSRIAQERIRLGLTQEEVAQKVGVTQKSISKYEKGDRRPSMETLIAMSTLFGVTVDYLIGNDEKPTDKKFFFFFFDECQGERIRSLMNGMSMSIQDLSNEIGIEQASIEKVLSSNEVDLDTVLKLADFFHVSTDYLLCRTDFPEIISQDGEAAEVLGYYSQLDKMEKRWVVGQMTDLIMKKEEAPLDRPAVAAAVPMKAAK